MKINLDFRRKLAVYTNASSMCLTLFRFGKSEASEKILLRETPEEMIKSRASAFLKNRRPSETLLILPRSEVLQKELVFSAAEAPAKQSIQKKLEEILPGFQEELAYGISLEKGKASVLAIPEKPLTERLAGLNRSGIFPSEIVTEDQTFLWLLLERGEKGPLILFDFDGERILALFLKEGRILFSRSFTGTNPEFVSEFLSEISLLILESGSKPEKILFSGAWPSETAAQVRETFSQNTGQVEIAGEPACLAGAAHFGKFPVLSLLPRDTKVKKWQEGRKRLFWELGIVSLVLISLIAIGFFAHLKMLEASASKLDREIASLKPDAEHSRQMIDSLKTISRSRATKEKLLGLLKQMSAKFPSSITLSEIRSEEGRFALKGASPSHAYLTEAIQTLEAGGFLTNVKMGETRLRKRLNEDCVEFEIEAQWKI